MRKSDKDAMNSLSSLPGGIGDYLKTLVQILEWVDHMEQPRYDEFADWIMAQYNTGRAIVNVYARVVIRLRVIQKIKNNQLTLTDFGKQILAADNDNRARFLSEFLMNHYSAAREVLAIYAQAAEPLHLDAIIEILGPHFPTWNSSTQFDERIHWLFSLQCLQRVSGRYYEITALGRELSERYPPDKDFGFNKNQSASVPEITQEPEKAFEKLPVIPRVESESLQLLIDELTQTSTGNAYKDFERAIVKAFQYLGFTVVYLGDSGETDLLVVASIGPDSYRVIIDAKARHNGKLESVEVYTLQDHLRRHQANYAVVVAKGFASGKVARHAEDNSIVLLSVSVLIQWMVQYSKTPLNLADYRIMFTTPGVLDDLPAELVLIAEQRQKWPQLVVDLMELIQETYQHGLNLTLPRDQLFTMLATRLRGVRYSKQEVQHVISLLTHPVFACATGEGDNGISLVMNRRTFAHTLRALADLVDINEFGE